MERKREKKRQEKKEEEGGVTILARGHTITEGRKI